MEPNEQRCQSMAYNILLNVADGHFKGMRHQLQTLGSCGDCMLNFKLSKLNGKMSDIGEEEGILYYRSYIDTDVWRMLPLRKQINVYHTVNKHWLLPTVAALLGVGPIAFKAFTRKFLRHGTPTRAPKPTE